MCGSSVVLRLHVGRDVLTHTYALSRDGCDMELVRGYNNTSFLAVFGESRLYVFVISVTWKAILVSATAVIPATKAHTVAVEKVLVVCLSG